jgi:hypothetical protein
VGKLLWQRATNFHNITPSSLASVAVMEIHWQGILEFRIKVLNTTLANYKVWWRETPQFWQVPISLGRGKRCSLHDRVNVQGYQEWLSGWSDATRLATSFSRCNPMWFISIGLRQGSGLCFSSSRKYPGSEGRNQNRHWNHHRWHATNNLERSRLSCWCL